MTAKTILLLEDDPSVVRLLEASLRGAAFRTVEARTVGEAWREVQDRPVDAAIVDIHLPGVNGWEFIERLRRDPTWHDLPVLIVSGAIGAAELTRCAELRCGVLEKPFDPDDLVARVQAQIGYDRKQDRRSYAVRVILGAFAIEGDIHLSPEKKRFSDGIEALMAAEGSLISMTRVQVMTFDGKVLYEAPFAQVGKAQIRTVIPTDQAV